MNEYTVKEVFKTIQGEGSFAGAPAVFVRLAGCNIWSGKEHHRDQGLAPCAAWCDTDFTKAGAVKMNPAMLIRRIVAAGQGCFDFVVLTGGEPMLQLDDVLLEALQSVGLRVHIETNGTQALRHRLSTVARPNWVTVSPKLPDKQTVIEYADEIKFVVPDYHPSDYPQLIDRCVWSPWGYGVKKPIFVQIEDSARTDASRDEALGIVETLPGMTLGVQIHKTVEVP